MDDSQQKQSGPSDATNYSSTQAPETQKEAEEQHPFPSDTRLVPGGAHGSHADPGMSSLDDGALARGGRSTTQDDLGAARGQQDFGSTRDAKGS